MSGDNDYARGFEAGVESVAQDWEPMDCAPKDGPMLALLVKFTEHATEDAETAVTIGGWNGEAWTFAGWCWTHDHFTQGEGEIIGWQYMPRKP